MDQDLAWPNHLLIGWRGKCSSMAPSAKYKEFSINKPLKGKKKKKLRKKINLQKCRSAAVRAAPLSRHQLSIKVAATARFQRQMTNQLLTVRLSANLLLPLELYFYILLKMLNQPIWKSEQGRRLFFSSDYCCWSESAEKYPFRGIFWHFSNLLERAWCRGGGIRRTRTESLLIRKKKRN